MPSYGGLDLSTKVDITAWVLVFPPDDTSAKWRVLPRFFVPRDNIERRERTDRVPYRQWVNQGFLTATDGNVVDGRFVMAKVLDDARRFDVRKIGFDPWNAAFVAQELMNDGAPMVEFRQGYASLSEPAKELEALVLKRELEHFGNPVLRWMAGNAAIEHDPAGNIKPSKKKSTERIDGIVAMTMALGLALGGNDGGCGYRPGELCL